LAKDQGKFLKGMGGITLLLGGLLFLEKELGTFLVNE
jgi:hypothetical protein